MNIIMERKWGVDKRLPPLMATVDVIASAIRFTNNYPFSIYAKKCLFVAIDNASACGFVPVRVACVGILSRSREG